jgi:flagellar basal body P-ring protein FlgI
MKKTKLTSIKILEGLYQEFKTAIVNSSMTFQKLANRSIHLYLKDNDFREILETEDTLNTVSGSRF